MRTNHKKNILKNFLTSVSVAGILCGAASDALGINTRIVREDGKLSDGSCFAQKFPFNNNEQIRYDGRDEDIITADIADVIIKAIATNPINPPSQSPKTHTIIAKNDFTVGSIGSTAPDPDPLSIDKIKLLYDGALSITLNGLEFEGDNGRSIPANTYNALKEIDFNNINNFAHLIINSKNKQVIKLVDVSILSNSYSILDIFTDFIAQNSDIAKFTSIHISDANLNIQENSDIDLAQNLQLLAFSNDNSSLTLTGLNAVSTTAKVGIDLVPGNPILGNTPDSTNTITLVGNNNAEFILDMSSQSNFHSLGKSGQRIGNLILSDAKRFTLNATELHAKKIEIAGAEAGAETVFNAPIKTGEGGELSFTTDNQIVLLNKDAQISQIKFNGKNNSKITVGAVTLTLGDDTISQYTIGGGIQFKSRDSALELISGANLGKTNPVTINVESDLVPSQDRRNTIVIQNRRTDGGELVLQSDGGGLRRIGKTEERFQHLVIANHGEEDSAGTVRIKNVAGTANEIDISNFLALELENNTKLVSETNSVMQIEDISIGESAVLDVDLAPKNGTFALLPTDQHQIKFEGQNSTLNIKHHGSDTKNIEVYGNLAQVSENEKHGIVNFNLGNKGGQLHFSGDGSLGLSSIGSDLNKINVTGNGTIDFGTIKTRADSINVQNNASIIATDDNMGFGTLNIGVESGTTNPQAEFVASKNSEIDFLFLGNNINLNEPNATLVLQNQQTNPADATFTLRRLTPAGDGIGNLNLVSGVEGKKLIVDVIVNDDGGAGIQGSIGSNDKRMNILQIEGQGNTRIKPDIFVNSINISSSANTIFEKDINRSQNESYGDMYFYADNSKVTLEGDTNLSTINFLQTKDATIEVANGKSLSAQLISSSGEGGVVKFLGDGTLTNNSQDFDNGIKRLEVGQGSVLIQGKNTINEIRTKGNKDTIFEDGFELIGGINTSGGVTSNFIFKGNGNVSGGIGSSTINPIGSIKIQGGTGKVVDLAKNIYANCLEFSGQAGGTLRLGGDVVNVTEVQMKKDYNIEIYGGKDHTINFGVLEVDDIAGSLGSIRVVDVSDTNTATLVGQIGDINQDNQKLKQLILDGRDSVTLSGGDVHIDKVIFGGAGRLSLAGENKKYKFHGFNITEDEHPILEIAGNVSILTAEGATLNIGDSNSDDFKLEKLSFASDATLSIAGGINIYAKKLALDGNQVEIKYDLNKDSSVLDAEIANGEKLKALSISGDGSLTIAKQIRADQLKLFHEDSKFIFNKDGFNLDSPITGIGTVQFNHNSTINAPIGQDGAALKAIEFFDKNITINNNLFAKTITFDKSTVNLDKNSTFNGDVIINDAKFNLFSNTLTIQNGGVDLSDNIIIDTSVDGAKIGNIFFDSVSSINTTNLTNITVNVTVGGDNPEGNSLTIIDSNNNNVGIALNKFTTTLSGLEGWELAINDDGAIVLVSAEDPVIIDPPTTPPTTPPATPPTTNEEEAGVAEIPSSFAQADNGSANTNNGNAGADALIASSTLVFAPTLDITAANNAANNHAPTARKEMSNIFVQLNGQISTHLSHIAASEALPTPVEVSSNGDVIENIGVSAGSGEHRYGVWVKPYLGTSKQKKTSSVSGYNSDVYGGIIGFDVKCNDNLTVGIAGMLAESEISHKDNNSGDKTDLTTWMGSVYGLYKFSNECFAHGSVSYSTSQIKTKHQRIVGDNLVLAQGKHRGNMVGGEVLAGYHYRLSSSLIATPMVGFGYSHSDNKGFKENGAGNQNANVSSDSSDRVDGIVGVRMTVPEFQAKNGVSILPQAHAFVRHDLKGSKHQVDVNFAENINGALATKTVKTNRTMGNLGVGADFKYKMTEIGITYDLAFAEKYIGHQGSVKVRVNF